jgi:hypothetical protein
MVVAAFGQSSPLDLPEALAAKLSHSIAPELPPPRI